MQLDLLEILACPSCAGALSAPGVAPGQPALEEGHLLCSGCERRWPVIRGVPRFLVSPPEGIQAQTARRFGQGWEAFPQLWDLDRQQLLDWIHPVSPDFLAGKRVLDLGCGKGRHAVQAHRFGAGRVVAVDLSDAVELAREHTRDLPGVDVIQADLLQLPFKPAQFDYGWSIGVLHHLPEPVKGFRALARQIRPGGGISAWVYASEGNGWIRRLVDPLRRRVQGLPFPWIRLLSRLLASALFLVLHGIYVPVQALSPQAARRLFYGPYLLALSRHPFTSVESVVLDQLVAPLTHYIPRKDFLGWFQQLQLEGVRTSWLHGNSWRGFATVPEGGLPDLDSRRIRRRSAPRS